MPSIIIPSGVSSICRYSIGLPGTSAHESYEFEVQCRHTVDVPSVTRGRMIPIPY